MGYMTAMVSVVVKTSEAMGIGAGTDGAFHLEETVPPKLDAILQLLLTPIDKCDREKRSINLLPFIRFRLLHQNILYHAYRYFATLRIF